MPTALIIGASRGIGLELVRQYVADGWRVIATARDDAGRDRIQALGAQCLRVDVANPISVTSFEWMLDGEKLDLALYVAGVIDHNAANTPPTQDAFDRVMHTNVMGAMMVIPQVAPMVEAANGVFACISSVMGSLQGTRSSDAALYRISKAALNMVVRTSQPEYPRARMVAMHPGWVQTEMGGSTPRSRQSKLSRACVKRWRTSSPNKRGSFCLTTAAPSLGDVIHSFTS